MVPPHATTETRLTRRLMARRSEPPLMKCCDLAVGLPALRRETERRASRPRGRAPAKIGVETPELAMRRLGGTWEVFK